MSWLNCWVDENNDPDFNKGAANGITGWFLPLRDTARTTRAKLNLINSEGMVNGVYVGHNWFPGLTPVQYAAKIKSLLDPVRIANTRLQVNLEQHDPTYIVAVLTELRRLYPSIGLSWALEGMQGGWARGIAPAVNLLKVRVVPELFRDPMANITLRSSDPAAFYTAVKKELRSEALVLADLAGFNAVSLFHPGEWLVEGAEGFVFTAGRLP